MSLIWTIVIGFVAGVIAKFLVPGKNEPSGFVLTTIVRSWPPTSARRLAGIEKAMVPA